MWRFRDDEEKERELEKLIDRELSTQLTWAVLFLTATFGVLLLFAGGLLKQWMYVSRSLVVSFNPAKAPFVVIFFLFVLGIDVSWYRLAFAFARIRSWSEMLPDGLLRKELTEKTVFKWLSGLLTKRTSKNEPAVRTEVIWLLIMFGDLLLVWMLVAGNYM